MDQPLSVWYCDRCGGEIDNPKDGIVTFDVVRDLALQAMLKGNFSLFHSGKCDDGQKLGSIHLESLLGDAGRSYLLTFLAPEAFSSVSAGAPSMIAVASISNFVDLFRRVQVPYYEEARRRFFDADAYERHENFSDLGLYHPEEFKRMIQK